MATINGTNNAERLNGTASADVIRGYGGGDIIRGLGGDDLLIGGDGGDLLDGGAGYDTIFYYDSTTGVNVNLATGRGIGGTAEGDGYVSIEAVWGSYFNDTITGRDDADEMLYGLDGADVMKGGGGADMLDGGTGNDILKGGGGADTLYGGAGNDTADYSQAGPIDGVFGISADLTANLGYGGDAAGDRLDSIENLTGSQYHDGLVGNDLANTLKGLDGIDSLYGRGGNDLLEGGNGDDLLDGGTGADTMRGGPGDDVYYVDSAADVVSELAGEGDDTIVTTVSFTLAAGVAVETLSAENFLSVPAVNLTGNELANDLTGNGANNELMGLGSADRLDGGAGFDRLFGGDGNDRLEGGLGPDDLFGGAGADTFDYRATADSGPAAGLWDVIHDFSFADGDRIGVGSWDANDLAVGHQTWTWIGGTNFIAPGQIQVTYNAVDTFLSFNTDTDAAAEATIRLLGLHAVTASWFQF